MSGGRGKWGFHEALEVFQGISGSFQGVSGDVRGEFQRISRGLRDVLGRSGGYQGFLQFSGNFRWFQGCFRSSQGVSFSTNRLDSRV